MIKTTYEEFLEQNDSMTYGNVGVSMMPLLKQGRDLFTVKKKGGERCKKYDVVLYYALLQIGITICNPPSLTAGGA